MTSCTIGGAAFNRAGAAASRYKPTPFCRHSSYLSSNPDEPPLKLARLNVAGGNIRKIAMDAAFLAAEAEGPGQDGGSDAFGAERIWKDGTADDARAGGVVGDGLGALRGERVGVIG
jgi:hypothetical protein